MIIILPIILAALTLFYLLCIFWLTKGLSKLQKGQNQNTPFVSVIIAARNEEQNISDCISALRQQSYQLSRFEIIIINDRSEDNTAAIVKSLMPGCPNLKLVHVEKRQTGFAPKKYALSLGVEKARGEIILTTDADCRPLPDWIKVMVACFDPSVGIVAGYSPLESAHSNPSRLQKIYALESLSLACVAAGGIGQGRPLTCSARNFAYRKMVYEEVGGFQKIARHISGDDDLFLHLVARETRWQIRYAVDPAGLVFTAPPASFNVFKNQRTRHASKGKHYEPGLVLILTGVWFYNFLLFSGLVLFPLFAPVLSLAALISFIFKCLGDFNLLKKGAQIFQKQDYLKIFPLATILHIPYVVVFGLLGTFKTFRWKGEVFEAQEPN